MFSMTLGNNRHAPPSHNQAKSRTAIMACCAAPGKPNPQRGWWRGAGGCFGSGALLILLPKCPLCIAGWLTLWTGAGTAMSIAMHLRPMLEMLFVISAILASVQLLMMKARHALRAKRASEE